METEVEEDVRQASTAVHLVDIWTWKRESCVESSISAGGGGGPKYIIKVSSVFDGLGGSDLGLGLWCLVAFK